MENKERKVAAAEKEGAPFGYNIVIKDSKCTGCGKCIPACPRGIFKMEDGLIVVLNNGLGCDGCSECRDVCDTRAISITEPLQ